MDFARLPQADLDTAVSEIHYVNHLWELSEKIFSPGSQLGQSLRNLKDRLQVELLMRHADATSLRVDDESDALSITVRGSARHTDAAHIPRAAAARALRERGLEHLLPSEGGPSS